MPEINPPPLFEEKYEGRPPVNRLGVKWFETRSVSSSAHGLRRSQVRGTSSHAYHGTLRFPYDPEALGLLRL